MKIGDEDNDKEERAHDAAPDVVVDAATQIFLAQHDSEVTRAAEAFLIAEFKLWTPGHDEPPSEE